MYDAENDYEDSLMVKSVWYYYMENMTQQAIADRLDISRMRVIKLLEKARQTGAIQFKIPSMFEKRHTLEMDLIKKFGLKDCYAASTDPDGGNLNDSIARAAAAYIANHMIGGSGSYINFGYGDTPSKTIAHLARSIETHISLVSLSGGVGYYLPMLGSKIFNAKLYLIPAPLIMSSKEMAEAMTKERSVEEVTNMISLANMTIVGIGAMDDDATIAKTANLTHNDFLLLRMKGAIGDINCHFIDKDGNVVDNDIDSRVISLPLKTLNELKNVIAVSGGAHKVQAIAAALKAGCIDILITDEETARLLSQVEI
ncbi:MAG: sugar-binding transcriptional regulator [Lachnospiraceae bacterium]|nr:sugar-binding transcriptional regulator [Lachnospiraceae bacterium]